MGLRDPDHGWNVPQPLQEDSSARYVANIEIWDIEHEPGLEELLLVNG